MQARGRAGLLVAVCLGAAAAAACGGASAQAEGGVSLAATADASAQGVGSQSSTAAPWAEPGTQSGKGAGAAADGAHGDAGVGDSAPLLGTRSVPEDEGIGPAPGGLALATLPGFRLLPDGRSLVFLEMSGRAAVTETQATGRLTYHLRGVQVPVRTNRFDLPTDHFSTPVGRVRLLASGDGADLVIELRAPARPTARLEQSGRGAVLRIELPPAEPERVSDAAALEAIAPEP